MLARSAVDDQLQRAAGRRDVAEVKLVAVDAPGSRYIDFLVPGLLGMSLMGGGMWGVGFVTVDMRRRKLLKRFLATPMKKSHFLAGLMVSRMLFMVPEVLILLVFARYAFGVVIHGSLLAVVFLILLGAVTVFRSWPAGGQPGEDDRDGLGADESGDGADVDFLGHLLFVGAVSRGDPADHQVDPAHAADRLAAGRDARRGAARGPGVTRIGIMAAWGAISFVLALRWFRWR